MYRPFSRMNIMWCSSNIVVRFTFVHRHFNLCLELDQLKLKCEKGNASVVAAVYRGDENYGSSPIKQTAQSAMRLPALVFSSIQNITGQEDAQFGLTKEGPNRVNAMNFDGMMILADCCPPSTFLYISLSKSATLFIEEDPVHVQNTQLKPKHKWKYYFMTKNSIPIRTL